MTLPAAAKTGMPTITVAVFDSATVFEGLQPSDVIYRYDLPGTGISEGWAGTAVVDQVRQLAAEAWPEVRVLIDAASGPADLLQRLFTSKGVSSAAVEEAGPVQETEPDTGELPAVGRHRLRGDVAAPAVAGLTRPGRIRVPGVILICLALVAAASLSYAGIRWMSLRPSQPGVVAAATSSVKSSSSPPATETVHPPSDVELWHGTWSVTLPPGFHLEEVDSSVLAAGNDPDLRIYLASDPLYSIGADILFDELERLIAEDPQLSEPVRSGRTMTYVEEPGDGSRVRWTTWVEGANQLSVGCHTRVEPSVGQHAACSMAVGSFTAGG